MDNIEHHTDGSITVNGQKYLPAPKPVGFFKFNAVYGIESGFPVIKLRFMHDSIREDKARMEELISLLSDKIYNLIPDSIHLE